MQIRKAERLAVQTADYNQWHHEIEVMFSHLDLGVSDEELAQLTDDQRKVLWRQLQRRVTEELEADVLSFARQVAGISEVENSATRFLDQQQTSKQQTSNSARKLRRRA